MIYRMGHGDEIVLADAHFPGDSFNKNIIRADGHGVTELLEGIMPLFTPDQYVDHPLAMMAAVYGDTVDPVIEESYLRAIRITWPEVTEVERVERFAFYERARSAFAVVMTGEVAKYGNLILRKGVTDADWSKKQLGSATVS